MISYRLTNEWKTVVVSAGHSPSLNAAEGLELKTVKLKILWITSMPATQSNAVVKINAHTLVAMRNQNQYARRH